MPDVTDAIEAKVSSDPNILAAAQSCGPGGDCSSFSQSTLGNLGIKGVPRTAIQQFHASTPVSATPDVSKMSPGDLVFFDNGRRDAYNTAGKAANGGFVNHVGVYAGNGKFIADHGEGDPSTRTPQDLTQYLKQTGYRFMGAGRFGGNPVGGGAPDPTDAIESKYGQDPTDAIEQKVTHTAPALPTPPRPGFHDWGGLMVPDQPPPYQDHTNLPGQVPIGTVAGSMAGDATAGMLNPATAWAYPQAQQAATNQQPTNALPILDSNVAKGWTPQDILKTAQRATDADMATLFKRLPRGLFSQIETVRQGLNPQTFNTGIDTSGTGLPGAAQANTLANQSGARPVGEKAAATGPGGKGWDLVVRGIGKTIVGLGDPAGSFAKVSGDPDAFYQTIGQAYLAAVPQAAALAATGGASSLGSVALTAPAFQLFGGVPSDPEGVLQSIATIGALHGVHLSLGGLKSLPDLLSKVHDAPAFQAALDKLNLTDPQRGLIQQAADHFGVDPSAVRMGPDGKPIIQKMADSRQVETNVDKPSPSQVRTASQVVDPQVQNSVSTNIGKPPVAGEATGVSMATRAAEADQGLRPYPESTPGQSHGDLHTTARAAIDAGTDPYLRARQLAEGNKAPTDADVALIEQGSLDLQKQFRQAVASGLEPGTPAYDTLQAKIDYFDSDIDQLKGSSGRSLSAWKISSNIDTGEYQEVRHAYLNKAGTITPDIENQLRVHSEAVKTARAQAEDLRQQLEVARSADPDAIRQMVETPKPPQTGNPVIRHQRLQRIKADRAQAFVDLKKSLSQVGSGINPEALVHLGKIAWSYADELGTIRLPQLLDHVRGEIRKATGRDVEDQDIIDGMHAARPPQTISELQQTKLRLLGDIRRLNSESQAAQKVKATRRENAREAFGSMPKTEDTVDPKWLQDQISAKNRRVAEIDEHIKNGNVQALTPKSQAKMQLGAKYEEALRRQQAAEVRAKSFVLAARPRTPQDIALMMRRSFAISGAGPLVKIPVSAIASGISSPIENLAAKGVRLLSGIEGETEGRSSLAATTAAVKGYFSQTLKDGSISALLGNGTDLSRTFGTPQPLLSTGEKILSLPGHLHEALMYPAQKSAFMSSAVKYTDFLSGKGVDVSRPEIIETIGKKAYTDSLIAVFRNENAFTRAVRARLPANPTGRMLVEAMMPVLNLPTNIAGRLGEYAGGGIYGRLNQMLSHELDGAAQDAILRAYKRQGIGAAVMAAGYFLPQYSQNIPQVLENTPLARVFKWGGSIRKNFDGRGDIATKPGNSVGQIGRDIATNLPAAETATRMGTAILGDHYKDENVAPLGKAAADYLLGWLVPAGIESAMNYWRDPEAIKSGREAFTAHGFREELQKGNVGTIAPDTKLGPRQSLKTWTIPKGG